MNEIEIRLEYPDCVQVLAALTESGRTPLHDKIKRQGIRVIADQYRALKTEDLMTENDLKIRIKQLVCELTEDEDDRAFYTAKFYELATESQRKAGQANKGKPSPARARAAQLNGRFGGTPAKYLVLEPAQKRKIDQLPDNYRNVLLKRELMTCQEIAESLGVTRQAVSKLEKQAIKALEELR